MPKGRWLEGKPLHPINTIREVKEKPKTLYKWDYVQSGNSNGSYSTFPGKRRQQKNKKGMKDWSTFTGLTLENPLGASAGATCIFLLISALLRRFLKPDLLFLVSVKCQLLWGLSAWLRSPSATSEILILIKSWWNWCSFEHALCTLLAAPGCNVRVLLILKKPLCVLHQSCQGLLNLTQPLRLKK